MSLEDKVFQACVRYGCPQASLLAAGSLNAEDSIFSQRRYLHAAAELKKMHGRR